MEEDYNNNYHHQYQHYYNNNMNLSSYGLSSFLCSLGNIGFNSSKGRKWGKESNPKKIKSEMNCPWLIFSIWLTTQFSVQSGWKWMGGVKSVLCCTHWFINGCHLYYYLPICMVTTCSILSALSFKFLVRNLCFNFLIHSLLILLGFHSQISLFFLLLSFEFCFFYLIGWTL